MEVICTQKYRNFTHVCVETLCKTKLALLPRCDWASEFYKKKKVFPEGQSINVKLFLFFCVCVSGVQTTEVVMSDLNKYTFMFCVLHYLALLNLGFHVSLKSNLYSLVGVSDLSLWCLHIFCLVIFKISPSLPLFIFL